MLPDMTRGEALDDWEYARRHWGPDSPEVEEAAEVLEQLLQHPNDRSDQEE